MALRELGYIEGQNITIEYRYGELNRDRACDDVCDSIGFSLETIVSDLAEAHTVQFPG